VLEEIPNSGFTNGGKTYRLYAELTGGTLTQIFGDSARPHSVVTTTTFFNQDLFGTHSNLQSEVNTGAYGMIPLLEYDTWATLGDSYSSPPTTVGDVGFTANLSGYSWNFGGTSQSDAAIFRLPTDPLCVPDVNGRVLLAQFTTDGVLSGVINLNGLDGNGIPWEENQIPIPQLSVLGCTDATACNYNASANVDDGSCDLPNGCGDPLYLEYDASVTCSDASACLTLIVNGCTDATACNYNASANVDDGSCDLPNGCGDPLYL
ncbi:MAG: hypothetical protein GY899_09675, partial [Verrucomicrobiaceae bacterium]|nr:hypothetical protein [Verrucomicrobiaceae bacterium]